MYYIRYNSVHFNKLINILININYKISLDDIKISKKFFKNMYVPNLKSLKIVP
jgi:hypothetical protein